MYIDYLVFTISIVIGIIGFRKVYYKRESMGLIILAVDILVTFAYIDMFVNN